MKPVFSILIPTFNSRLTLELLLRCLEAQTWPRDHFECLIVDDGSTDGTATLLKGYQPGINLRSISHPTNRGRSHARNTACGQAAGDIFIFLDADMLPDPNWLADYAAAFAQTPALDVVSGGRYHLDLGAHPDQRAAGLAQRLGLPVEDLFVTQVDRQFEQLRATGRLAMYPSYAMERLEAQLPEVCRQYPDSLLSAYALITSNVAVRRRAFEQAGGFDTSLRRTEDTDLGVRLWELGARFGFASEARAYHLYHTGQGDHSNTLVERLTFFYRHPYLLVVLVNLWFAYQDQPDPAPPSSTFDSLLTLLAAGPELPNIDVAQEFYRIYRQPAWADCLFDRSFMAEYYGEHSGIAHDQIEAYLDQALARGLMTHRRDRHFYFDFDHTTNWLRKCTTYQQYELEHTRYSWIRDWIPGPEVEPQAPPPGEGLNLERRSGPLSRPPLAFRCRGIYEVSLPPAALPETGSDALLNIPLPVAHACQTEVQIVRCVPPNLLDYANRERTLVTHFPLAQGLDESGALTLCYEFECTLREHRTADDYEELASSLQHARYLRPTYAPAQLAKAEALLKKIFARPAHDSYTIAHILYTWILDNTRYLQSTLADHLILDTGFGPCFHLARLFVNLCRLMRVPAREQCGALFGRRLAPDTPQRTVVTGRGYNILTHTWAEFYSPAHGWVPVEFSAADLGQHILTATNVRDPHLRDQLIRETDLYHAYYFGRLDPFRIYADEQANRVPTYPLTGSRLGQDALKRLIFQTRHRLICDFSGSAEFADLRTSLRTLAEASRASSIPSAQVPAKLRGPRRVIVTSLGSTGDVQPLLALADELRRRGAEVVFALPAIFQDRIRSLGFQFAEIGQGTALAVWHEVFARQARIADPLEQMRYFVEAVVPRMPQIFHELREVCSGADVLISPPFQLAARMVHDATGLPFVSIHFSPFGSQGNQALRDVSAPLVNWYRQQAGLPPLADPLGADGASPQLALYAVSRHVFRPSADWPPHHQLTGYFFLDEETWQPDPRLVEFVEAGERPVVVTFGSMPSDDPEALTDLILTAVKQAGCRAVIQRGGGGLARERSLPEQVCVVDFVPHGWLFPRAACVVHHGGAGTTAATFRAGVPAVIVPHLLDQPIWAEFACALGCAGAAIPRARLTAEQLSAAIIQTRSQPRYQRAAARLGEQIRAENGVRTAGQLIEQQLFAAVPGP